MIKRADVSQSRINEFLSYTPAIKNESAALTPALTGEIDLRKLSFTYPGTNVPALKQITLKIKVGERIAIVGKTGSGKTTLARILLRLYDPQEGEYLLNDQRADLLSLQHLRKQFAYVPQDIFLFSDSIRNNICFGSDEASEMKVKEVADLACLSQELEHMKDGLQTMVGERGVTLSGGQRQRVAVARSLLLEKAVIALFDDCLSAVDAETEERLFKNISGFLKQKTMIFITHRLTQLTEFDRIIVLDKGEVAEMGTYRQLTQNNGLFHRLIKEQQMHDNNP
jgi:ATP-binding cassette subfamily B protein